jgi:hypothetical protein
MTADTENIQKDFVLFSLDIQNTSCNTETNYDRIFIIAVVRQVD